MQPCVLIGPSLNRLWRGGLFNTIRTSVNNSHIRFGAILRAFSTIPTSSL